MFSLFESILYNVFLMTTAGSIIAEIFDVEQTYFHIFYQVYKGSYPLNLFSYIKEKNNIKVLSEIYW